MFSKFSTDMSSRFLAFTRRSSPNLSLPRTGNLSPYVLFSTHTTSSQTYHLNCEQTSKGLLTVPLPSLQFSPRPRQTAVHAEMPRINYQAPALNFEIHEDYLRVDFGEGKESKFDYIWLRDNCRCSKCFHPITKQRLLETFQIPLDIRPTDVQVTSDNSGITIQWPDNHSTFMPVSFLRKYSCDQSVGDKTISGSERTFWDRTLAALMPTVQFDALFEKGDAGDRAVLEWLQKIYRYGFCLVDDVPSEPVQTEKLLRRISFLRQTHYGGFWDFTPNLEHGDTAYTNLPLGAHTDTTYFSDPAGLQLFHLLSPAESHVGGRTLLVDGFAAASRLKKLHPWAYDTLAEVPIETHASGGTGVAIRPLLPSPILTHHPVSGELAIIRWNADDRRPLQAMRCDEIKRWYSAAREWEKIIKSPEMELWTQLKTGQALIFDNQRVLHGRSGFNGTRRMCGAYINGDDYRSRLRSLVHQFRSKASNTSPDNNSVWNDID